MSRKFEICEKAIELFNQRGYDNTPMSHIAKALDISKANLYHHFSNKEELLFTIIEQRMKRELLPIIDHAVGVADPETRLRTFLKDYAQLIAKDNLSRTVLHEAHRLNADHFKIIQAYHRKLYDVIHGAIEELESQGRITAPDKAFYTFAAIGMCTWTFYWFDYGREETAGRLAETYSELFLNGLLSTCGDSGRVADSKK